MRSRSSRRCPAMISSTSAISLRSSKQTTPIGGIARARGHDDPQAGLEFATSPPEEQRTAFTRQLAKTWSLAHPQEFMKQPPLGTYRRRNNPRRRPIDLFFTGAAFSFVSTFFLNLDQKVFRSVVAGLVDLRFFSFATMRWVVGLSVRFFEPESM